MDDIDDLMLSSMLADMEDIDGDDIDQQDIDDLLREESNI